MSLGLVDGITLGSDGAVRTASFAGKSRSVREELDAKGELTGSRRTTSGGRSSVQDWLQAFAADRLNVRSSQKQTCDRSASVR